MYENMIRNSHIVLKGMQPQSEINNKSKFKSQQQQQLPTTPTSRNTATRTTQSASVLQQNPTPTPTTAAATAAAFEGERRISAIKVVKCNKPLCNFIFYLDIRDHQLSKRIEEQINLLGGTLQFFLTSSVTHFITDKKNFVQRVGTIVNNRNNSLNPSISSPCTPQTPHTPVTPQRQYNLECLTESKASDEFANKRVIRKSRADAILNRARRQSTIAVFTSTASHLQGKYLAVEEPTCLTPLKHNENPINNDANNQTLSYVIWQCEVALRFFKKVQHELKHYLAAPNESTSKFHAIEPISLKGGFIKFESIKRNYRPYYHLFKKPQEWPKIQLSREDGAFRLSPKKDFPIKQIEEIEKISPTLDGGAVIDNMTRKSRSTTSKNHQNNLKNKANDFLKSPNNSQKQLQKCKNPTPQNQKDSSDKQCGVCEICKIEYDALTIHLKTKDHEYFAKNSQNFMALDSLIHASADVNKFLDENRKLEIKTELEEMEVDDDRLVIIEQDPLQSSENENDILNDVDDDNDNDNDDDDDDDEDGDESQKSSSITKRKYVERKIISPTRREKSKRSTKGKHSSEKFRHSTLTTAAKVPKASSSQKTLGALDVKTTFSRKKPPSTALSPPIRAMLPPNSMYKVVETHADVNSTPPRGKNLAAGLNNDSKAVGSPSIIVKFKKVRATELQLLSGEAENFMFPKKRRDSSELPTDMDRHTTSDRMQHTQSSQQILTSCSSSEEQDPNEDYKVKNKPILVAQGKKAKVKAKRRLSKATLPSTSKSTSRGKIKQSFPETPIQPNEQLKSETTVTTAIATTKRKSAAVTKSYISKAKSVHAAVPAPNKIVLPEATRKSSRTATAIVTAATTSTRLLQAAVEAAKSKHKLETSKLPSMLPPYALPMQCEPVKRLQIKHELKSNSEEEEESGNDLLHIKCKAKKLRCGRKSVVKMEDGMGDTNKKPQNFLNKSKLTLDFDADDYEDDDDDDDVTIDDGDDDEKDEDFIIQSSKVKSKLLLKTTKKQQTNKLSSSGTPVQKSPPASKSLSKGKRSTQTTLMNTSVREERLARRQSRIITQLQLELQTGSEEEPVKEIQKTKLFEKRIGKAMNEKSPSKASSKLSKLESTTKKSLLKTSSRIKQEPSAFSRYFDHTKSERLKDMSYAFERLPASDLWYRVYKRQDNCEEKYFEYFGSTKYRKLPYELGPIPFDSTLLDHSKHKMCCKLCEASRIKKEVEKTKKLHVRRDLKLDLKSEPNKLQNNTNSLESQGPYHCSSTSVQNKMQQQELSTSNQTKDQEHSKSNCSSYTMETKSYAHKHKKLHLLQRYRQELEQQEILQRRKVENQIKSSRLVVEPSEIITDDAVQECLPYRSDRAGSPHSNASSCNSSIHTNCKSKKIRKKLLNKVSFLANLELPPRKSPREHASTLALVSCIIKQRQDSISKPNSETDEVLTTPIETDSNVLTLAADQLSVCDVVEKEPPTTPPPSQRKTSAESPASNVVSSPRTRSQAATPIEELRFATEISETVKRMRRGRNKYDYSPPFVQRTIGRSSSTRGRGRGGSKSLVNLFSRGQKVASAVSPPGSLTQQMSHTSNPNLQAHTLGNAMTRGRRRRGRQKGYNSIQKSPKDVLTSIRKTGSKKGVLEFDVDNIAVEALKKATTDYVNPKVLEWQIDKFLIFENREDENSYLLPAVNVATPFGINVDEDGDDVDPFDNRVPVISDIAVNTPPATDYFSSDFDLCDIINQSYERLQEDRDNASHLDRRSKKFSIFNTVLLNNYYRKRKNPKTNRTGWPKAPKKKAVTRQQSTHDKIYFLQNGNIREENSVNIAIKKEVVDDNIDLDEDDTTQERTRESGVITPPDSENDTGEHGEPIKMSMEEYEESLLVEEDSQMVLNEDSQTVNDDDNDDNCGAEEDDLEDCARIIEDNITLADSADDDDEIHHMEEKADSDADADIEEVDDDDERNTRRDKLQLKSMEKKLNKKCKRIIPKIIENDDEDSYEPQEKRQRGLESPIEKIRTNLLNPTSAHTSTPTTPFMRALRRTPQLNGSLGSWLSPSEKAGDNSDIFTVSSDGLDTDLDLSNSHSQLRSTTSVGFDEDNQHHPHPHTHTHHHQHHHHHNTSLHNNSSTTTPRRKFDISKYAPSNSATCAAEAATAAVKSLAISQFLKKEVRVTCRRLRAPFRRFRYRR